MYPFPSTRSMQIVHEQMDKEAMDPPREHSGRKDTHPACNGILLLKRLGKRQQSGLAEARTRLLALLSPHHRSLGQKSFWLSQSDAGDAPDTRSPFDVSPA